jgi:hypothetical protein
LIDRLLDPNSKTRLGAKGFDEIKEQKFFNGKDNTTEIILEFIKELIGTISGKKKLPSNQWSKIVKM